MKFCWFFPKNQHLLIKFVVFRTGFDENSSEFQFFFFFSFFFARTCSWRRTSGLRVTRWPPALPFWTPYFRETLAGSFSSVSKPIFATKVSFCSIFRDLQDLHSFAPVETQNFYKNSYENLLIFSKKSTFFIKFIVFRTGFDENSLEFQHFFRNLWRIFEISLILTHSEWGGCQKWRNNFRENTDFSS